MKKIRYILAMLGWMIVASIIPAALCVFLFMCEQEAAKSAPLVPAKDDHIAAIISECTVNAVDASHAPLLLMCGPEEMKREQASFLDAFWMLAQATADSERLAPDDAIGKRHLENIHALYRAYDIEFKKPYPNLDRARRVRKFMEDEGDSLHRRVQKP